MSEGSYFNVQNILSKASVSYTHRPYGKYAVPNRATGVV